MTVVLQAEPDSSRRDTEVAHAASGRDALGNRGDALGVKAELAIEVRDRARLPEAGYPEGAYPMPAHGPELTESRRVAVDHRHERAVPGHLSEKAFDMGKRTRDAPFARGLGAGPSSVKPVGRNDG